MLVKLCNVYIDRFSILLYIHCQQTYSRPQQDAAVTCPVLFVFGPSFSCCVYFAVCYSLNKIANTHVYAFDMVSFKREAFADKRIYIEKEK